MLLLHAHMVHPVTVAISSSGCSLTKVRLLHEKARIWLHKTTVIECCGTAEIAAQSSVSSIWSSSVHFEAWSLCLFA